MHLYLNLLRKKQRRLWRQTQHSG